MKPQLRFFDDATEPGEILNYISRERYAELRPVIAYVRERLAEIRTECKRQINLKAVTPKYVNSTASVYEND